MKKSGRSFRLIENHLEIAGTENYLSWGDIWRKVKAIEESRKLELCSHIDPFLIVNMNLRTGKDDARILRNLNNKYYRGAALGPLFQKLFTSIKEEGCLKPIWAWVLPEDHEYWRRRPYKKNSYIAEDGRHRAVVCQFWNILLPAYVIEANPL